MKKERIDFGLCEKKNKHLGDVIPINRAIISKLSDLLMTVDDCFLRRDRSFNATLITFNGFMRQDTVYNAPEIIKVPKRMPITVTTQCTDIPEVVDIEIMVFQLDRWQSTKEHLIYREVKA